MKFMFVTLLLISLIMASTFVEPLNAQSGICGSKCKARCSKAGIKDRCMKYCNICCMKCKCVPSGTYGNKHECPCYRDMKNNKNKPKCP
ncbi:Gibberellin-regulated protein 10 [Bienertia sinuspersici]